MKVVIDACQSPSRRSATGTYSGWRRGLNFLVVFPPSAYRIYERAGFKLVGKQQHTEHVDLERSDAEATVMASGGDGSEGGH